MAARALWGLLLALAVSSVAGGCASDECVLGEMQCDGQYTRTCEVARDKLSGNYNAWELGLDCRAPERCIQPSKKEAYCVASPEKHAACKGSARYVCEENHLLTCRDGYAELDLDCSQSHATCRTATTAACVDAEPVADPLSLCDGLTQPFQFCSGDTQVSCFTGTGSPPQATSCPECRLFSAQNTSIPYVDFATLAFFDSANCAGALGDACSTEDPTQGCGWGDWVPQLGVQCWNNTCTVACGPNGTSGVQGDAGCQALLDDPAHANLLSAKQILKTGRCGADGFCAWGT